MGTQRLLDLGVMAVPGLAFLAGTAVLPGALLTGLTAATVAVTIAAVAGYLLTHRASVEAWPPRRAGRWIVGLAVAALVLLVGYTLTFATVVATYTVAGEAPGTRVAVDLLVPAVVADGGLVFPYIDCRLSFANPCRWGVEGVVRATAESAQGLADQMTADGEGYFRIPRGAAWTGWAALLVGWHTAATAALVGLAGLLRIRGVDVSGLFGGGASAAPPAPDAAEGAPPAGPEPEAGPEAAPDRDAPAAPEADAPGAS